VTSKSKTRCSKAPLATRDPTY